MLVTQATRARKVWSVLKVQLAHGVPSGYKVKMDRKESKDHSDLKVTLDHVDLVVKMERKGKEAPRVIWDLQVHKEKLVEEETWDRKVNQVTKV